MEKDAKAVSNIIQNANKWRHVPPVRQLELLIVKRHIGL